MGERQRRRPTGTLMKKIHRQLAASTIAPPTTGPITGPRCRG